MKSSLSTVLPRALTKALSIRRLCRYPVVAIGIDKRGTIISIKSNTPRDLKLRGWHAEQRVMFSSPRSLRRIYVGRVLGSGLVDIDPCVQCARMAVRRGIEIRGISDLDGWRMGQGPDLELPSSLRHM